MSSAEYMKQGIALQDRLVKTQQSSQLAEMGAAQLEQYGPQGQQWAQRLRQNPRAALAMAEQYGGFAQIEAGFRYAAANGQAATADEMTRLGLTIGGGTEGLAVGKAFDAATTSDTPRVTKDAFGAIRNLGGPAHGDIAFAGDLTMGHEAAGKIRSPRLPRAAKYAAANDLVAQMLTLDVNDTAWERALVTLSNKGFDNSAVMQGEADATVRAMLSVMGQIRQTIANVMDAKGNIPIAERKQMQRMVLESQMAVLEEAPPEWAGWESDNLNQHGLAPGTRGSNFLLPDTSIRERSERLMLDMEAKMRELNSDPELVRKDRQDRLDHAQGMAEAQVSSTSDPEWDDWEIEAANLPVDGTTEDPDGNKWIMTPSGLAERGN